jgi:hypothetical protein
MDEKTIFSTLLTFFLIYYSNSVNLNICKNIINYYLDEVLDLFRCNIFDGDSEDSEKKELVEEKPIIKYEDKFLKEIRKLDKEFQFNEREKEILLEKETTFFQTTQNNCKNKIEENKSRICVIEIELSNLEKCTLVVEDSELDSDNISDYSEEEDTKEEKIDMLTNEKSNLYVEIQKMDKILSQEEELLNKAKEFALNFVIDLRLEKIVNCFTMEMTPQGNVLMTYDIKKGSFKYYSDHTIPYRYLEVVSRKYVKQFNCRPLYVDMEEELELSEKRWEKDRKEKEEKDEKEKEKEENKIVVPEKKNVFAKFKSYNKEGSSGRVNIGVPPKNSIPNTKEQEREKILLKEKANCYTYEGKLVNFSFLKKVDRKVVDKKYNLSFADFKKLQIIK